jgi:hypothetical protein
LSIWSRAGISVPPLRGVQLEGLELLVLGGGRALLDAAELELPFDGNILFEDMEEINLKVTADPQAIRKVYRKVVEEFIDHLRKECRENSIDYQLLSTATPLDHALVSYLSWRG